MVDDVARLRRALLLAFWGLLLVVCEVHVGRVELPPDVLSWVVVAAALWLARGTVDDDTFRARTLAAGLLAVGAAALAGVYDLGPRPDAAYAAGGLGTFAYTACALGTLAFAALAILRVVHVTGATHLRRPWQVSLVATVGGALAAAVIARSADGPFDPVAALVAAFFAAAGFLTYLANLLRTRAALAG